MLWIQVNLKLKQFIHNDTPYRKKLTDLSVVMSLADIPKLSDNQRVFHQETHLDVAEVVTEIDKDAHYVTKLTSIIISAEHE